MARAIVITFASLVKAHDSHGAVCPGSPASMHAWLALSVSADASCAAVRAEALARVRGQGQNWYDPHENGTYGIVAMNSDNSLRVNRVSANERYTDLVHFTYEEIGAESCRVEACSESQGNSGGDQSTNLCNIWNLVCNIADGCCPVLTDFTWQETNMVKSSGAGESQFVCLGGSGGSGGFSGGPARQTECLYDTPALGGAVVIRVSTSEQSTSGDVSTREDSVGIGAISTGQDVNMNEESATTSEESAHGKWSTTESTDRAAISTKRDVSMDEGIVSTSEKSANGDVGTADNSMNSALSIRGASTNSDVVGTGGESTDADVDNSVGSNQGSPTNAVANQATLASSVAMACMGIALTGS